MPMIALIDYGMGNLRSVAKALEHVGAEVSVTADAEVIASAEAAVLPGVGAFGRCMENLETAGLCAVVRDVAGSGRPFLGICVGMQILFEESNEFGRVEGLGILPGRVRRFEPGAGELKVPHMGWNTIDIARRPPLLRGVPDGAYLYFVHSYYVEAGGDGDIVATTTQYGVEFVSSVWQGNIFATQFHPEKSQGVGLRIYDNFAALSAGWAGAL